MNSVDSQQINYTMNIIWTTLVALSIIIMTITNPNTVLNASIDGANTAITTSIALCGMYCFWGGVFGIMQDCKLTHSIAALFGGLISKLFGANIPQESVSHIAINMSANLIGVSNASTPSAIAAIKQLEGDNTVLSRAGAMLFVINATSIQLLPTTIMGIRAGMGSLAPTNIALPNLISTVITTILGVLLVNLTYGRAK